MTNSVISGNFQRYSGGHSIPGAHFVEFIEVGEKRYAKVVWSTFMDTFIRDALGKQIRLSLRKVGPVHVVGAIEFDSKIEKEPDVKVAGSYSALGGVAMLALIPLGFAIVAGVTKVFGLAVIAGALMIIPYFTVRRSNYKATVNALDRT